jgi:hypothetical protein
LVVPGMGQCLVNKEPLKGTLFFVGTWGLYLYLFLDKDEDKDSNKYINVDFGGFICGIVFLGIYIWNIVDATTTASNYNENLREAKSKAQKILLTPSIVPVGMNNKDLGYGITLRINF